MAKTDKLGAGTTTDEALEGVDDAEPPVRCGSPCRRVHVVATDVVRARERERQRSTDEPEAGDPDAHR